MKKTPTISSDLMKNAAPIMFGLIIVMGFFGVLGSLLWHEFPPANKDFIASLAKTLETILVMAISFWFGSNSSSKAKDETISDIAKLPTPSSGIGQRATDKPIAAKDIDIVAKGDVTIEPEKPKDGGDV